MILECCTLGFFTCNITYSKEKNVLILCNKLWFQRSYKVGLEDSLTSECIKLFKYCHELVVGKVPQIPMLIRKTN